MLCALVARESFDRAQALTITGGPGAGLVQSDVLDDVGVPSIFCINSQETETTCRADFAGGTPVILTASPSLDSTSVNWTGCDVVDLGKCTVTMNSHRTVTADIR